MASSNDETADDVTVSENDEDDVPDDVLSSGGQEKVGTALSLVEKADGYFKLDHYDPDGKNLAVKCLLCIPTKKPLKTSVSSGSNLARHIRRVHKTSWTKFSEILNKKENPRRQKRVSSSDCNSEES